MDTFPGSLYEEKYPWILFPEMKLYPVGENRYFGRFLSKIHIVNVIDIISFPGKVSMDTFPPTLYVEKYPWILFPEMKLSLVLVL